MYLPCRRQSTSSALANRMVVLADLTHDYRIAWVEHNEDAKDIVDFIETVLLNRGLPGRAFDSEEEAREWLLGD